VLGLAFAAAQAFDDGFDLQKLDFGIGAVVARGSAVEVRVIPTDEESVIARSVQAWSPEPSRPTRDAADGAPASASL